MEKKKNSITFYLKVEDLIELPWKLLDLGRIYFY